ncbi:MAG: hypothetical protein JWM57_2155, partial [Phycisphaerales bacterium]|nr:hypothetical protein [Phycisphaerales bacterium]
MSLALPMLAAGGEDPTVKIIVGVAVAAFWVIAQIVGALSKKPEKSLPPSGQRPRPRPTVASPPPVQQRTEGRPTDAASQIRQRPQQVRQPKPQVRRQPPLVRRAVPSPVAVPPPISRQSTMVKPAEAAAP